MTPVHQLTSCETKSYLFVKKKNTFNNIFNLFLDKILNHNNSSQPQYCFLQWRNVVLSESGEKHGQIKWNL